MLNDFLFTIALHNWNRLDFKKLVVKFAYLIDVDEDTTNKTNVSATKLQVKSKDIEQIPLEFNTTLRWPTSQNQHQDLVHDRHPDGFGP